MTTTEPVETMLSSEPESVVETVMSVPVIVVAETPFRSPGDKVIGIITAIGVGDYYDTRCVTITVTNMGRDTTLYFTGSMRVALTSALKRAGVDRPALGGRVWVCYVQAGPGRDYPSKRLAAKYTPPGVAPSRPSRREGDRRG